MTFVTRLQPGSRRADAIWRPSRPFWAFRPPHGDEVRTPHREHQRNAMKKFEAGLKPLLKVVGR